MGGSQSRLQRAAKFACQQTLITGDIKFVKFSPDGLQMAIVIQGGSPLNGFVDVWRFNKAAATFEFCSRLDHQVSHYDQIAFLQDGQRLIIVDDTGNGQIKTINVVNKIWVNATLLSNKNMVVSFDGEFVACSSCIDACSVITVHHNPFSPLQMRALPGFYAPVLSSDGGFLATRGIVDRRINIFKLSRGGKEYTHFCILDGINSLDAAMVFSPKGKWLAIEEAFLVGDMYLYKTTFFILETHEYKEYCDIAGQTSHRHLISFSADELSVAIHQQGGNRISICGLPKFELINKLQLPNCVEIRDMRFSPIGECLAISFNHGRDYCGVKLYGYGSPEPASGFNNPFPPELWNEVFRNLTIPEVRAVSRVCRTWQGLAHDQLKKQAFLSHRQTVLASDARLIRMQSLEFTDNGKMLVVSCSGPSYLSFIVALNLHHLWVVPETIGEYPKGSDALIHKITQLEEKISHQEGIPLPESIFEFSGYRRYMAVSYKGKTSIFRLISEKTDTYIKFQELDGDNPKLSYDGKVLMVIVPKSDDLAGFESIIFRLKNDRYVEQQRLPSSDDAEIAISHSGKYIAITTVTPMVSRYICGRNIYVLNPCGRYVHCDEYFSSRIRKYTAFSPDETKMADATSASNSVKIVDLRTRTTLQSLEQGTSRCKIVAVAFAPTGEHLAVAYDRSSEVDMQELQLRATLAIDIWCYNSSSVESAIAGPAILSAAAKESGF